MVLFFPIQQELDCISDSGLILGKITFDTAKDAYLFKPDTQSVALSALEKAAIETKISKLNSGSSLVDMQDDD